MDNSTFSVGKNFPKIDSVEKATGRAKYGIDLKLDGMLHAKLLRSPCAHATVTNIDTSEALRMHGVRAIVTIEEVPKVVQYWFFLRTKKKEKQYQVERFKDAESSIVSDIRDLGFTRVPYLYADEKNIHEDSPQAGDYTLLFENINDGVGVILDPVLPELKKDGFRVQVLFDI